MTVRLTCDQVQERELVERYTGGTLPEPEAEALEQHVLECQVCWEDLQQAVELRAALGGSSATASVRAPAPAAVGPAPPVGSRAWRRVTIAALAAAAAAIIVVPIWRDRQSGIVTEPVTRGTESLEVHTTWQPAGDLQVTWTPVPGATMYRVRLLGAEGAPVVQQVTMPPATIPVAALPGTASLTVDIEAESAIGEVVARAPASAVAPRPQ